MSVYRPSSGSYLLANCHYRCLIVCSTVVSSLVGVFLFVKLLVTAGHCVCYLISLYVGGPQSYLTTTNRMPLPLKVPFQVNVSDR